MISTVDYGKAIEFNPQYAESYASRGLIFLQLQRDAQAQKDFDRCLELDKSAKEYLEQRIKYARYQRDKK